MEPLEQKYFRLKKKGEADLESLLLEIVDKNEKQMQKTGLSIPPFYYWELALIYRKKKEYDAEVKLLERFCAQIGILEKIHSEIPRELIPLLVARGTRFQKLAERLIKARQLRDKNKL
jgi:hypothetical protein